MNLIYLGKGMNLVSALLPTSSVVLGRHFYFSGVSLPPLQLSWGQQTLAELLWASHSRPGDLKVDETQALLSSATFGEKVDRYIPNYNDKCKKKIIARHRVGHVLILKKKKRLSETHTRGGNVWAEFWMEILVVRCRKLNRWSTNRWKEH